MTNERKHPDSAAETDKVVSATYRELGRESAPNILNEKVLQQAASMAARPRYLQSIQWTRPLAWVATITLCLAIVLELTRIPMPEIVVTREPVNALEAELPSSLELTPEPAQVPSQQQPEVLVDKKSQLGRAAAKQVADAPRRELRMREAPSEARADLEKVEEAVASDRVEFEMVELEMQDTNVTQRPDNTAVFALTSSNAAGRVTDECPGDERADPVTWLACIADLEESGNTEAALRQREALKETFPQFEMP